MSILEKAKQHFEAQERQEIEVPEWECTLYCKPMTVKQREAIMRKSGETAGDTALYTYAIIELAETKDGAKAFPPEARPVLMNEVDSKVINRIGREIFAYNSDKTPN